MEVREIFTIFRIVFDLLLIILISLVVIGSIIDKAVLPVDTMKVSCAVVIAGIVGHVGVIFDRTGHGKKRSGGV